VHDRVLDYSGCLCSFVLNNLELFFAGIVNRYESKGNYVTADRERFGSASACRSLGTNYEVITRFAFVSRICTRVPVRYVCIVNSLSLSLSLPIRFRSFSGEMEYFVSETALDLLTDMDTRG